MDTFFWWTSSLSTKTWFRVQVFKITSFILPNVALCWARFVCQDGFGFQDWQLIITFDYGINVNFRVSDTKYGKGAISQIFTNKQL